MVSCIKYTTAVSCALPGMTCPKGIAIGQKTNTRGTKAAGSLLVGVRLDHVNTKRKL